MLKFTEEELEGCPSVQCEDFVQSQIELITNISPRRLYREDKDCSVILKLLFKCWDAKKCPYA